MPGFKAAASGGVLLVTVDGTIGESVLHAMQAATISIEWARSLAELEARASRDDVDTPALVFLDLELPDAGGDRLVPQVRDWFPRAKTIALTAPITGESAARLLSHGVPSLTKPVSPVALTGLALRLSLGARPPWFDGAGGQRLPGERLETLLTAYAADRALSKQQQMILRLYLEGRGDKEIAGLCGCSEATVYEHWRRMARKVGGAHKGDAIADFHRFLASV